MVGWAFLYSDGEMSFPLLTVDLNFDLLEPGTLLIDCFLLL